MQIGKYNFKEEGICSGKALLYQPVGKTAQSAQILSRRRDEKERSVQDIITLLKDTNADDVPEFVAKKLHKFPSVGFDHVYVTRLLKDESSLASDKIVSGLQTELLLLRSSNSVSRSPNVAFNIVNVRRGAENASRSFESAKFDSPEAPVAAACASNRTPRPAARRPASCVVKAPTIVLDHLLGLMPP